MIHFWWLIHFSALKVQRKNFMYLIENVAIVEKLQNFKRSDENEFIDLNCGIQVTKVGLSSDWWFKYKSNSNLNNHTCSLHLQTHFLHFYRIWDNPAKFGTDWTKCFSKLRTHEPANYDREMTWRIVRWNLDEHFVRYFRLCLKLWKYLTTVPIKGPWYGPSNCCPWIHEYQPF